MRPAFLLFFYMIFLSAAVALGGSYTDNNFRNFSTATNLKNQDSLQLSISNFILAKLETITRPGNTNSRMRAPDVTGSGIGKFSFFWADSIKTNHPFDNIYKRDYVVTATGVDSSAGPVNYCNYAKPQVNYLHVDKGTNGYFLSFITPNTDSLRVFSEPGTIAIARVGGTGGSRWGSQCYWRKDTCLVVFPKVSDQKLLMRRIYLVGNTVTQSAKEDTVYSTADVGNHPISNPSLASDNLGNVLIMWLDGPPNPLPGFTKSLKCMVYNPNRAKSDSASFTTTVDSLGLSNFYDESPVVSYAPNSFGSVCWDSKGILFRSIRLGPPMIVDTVRLEAISTSRYPAITSNGNNIAVVWMTDSANSSYLKIHGIVDTIKPGYVPFTSNQNVTTFSDISLPTGKIPGKGPPAPTSFTLNCAMDSLGSIAATWPLDSLVQIRLWANRGVKTDSGIWISQATRFMTTTTDSSVIYPGSFSFYDQKFQLTNNDSARFYIRVGQDSADESAWSPWTLASDSAALAANTKGINSFFKYKLVLYRGQDTLGTPIVKNCNIKWNAKPQFQQIDSVYINNSKVATPNFGDTVSVFSRSDSVSVFFSLRDADATDTLYTHVNGYNAIIDSLDTLFPATGRFTRIKCLPMVKSDSVYNILFSAWDKKGWSASSKKIVIKTRNARPQLHAFTILDTNHTGKFDTSEIVSSKSFVLPQTDSIRFLFNCQDSNDAAAKAYAAVNLQKTDSGSQGTNKLITFKGSAGRAAGDTVSFTFADPETSLIRSSILRINHFPSILSLQSNGKTLHNRDTVSVGIGSPISVQVSAKDTDVSYWDTLRYRFTIGTHDTTVKTSTFSFVASLADTNMLVRIYDIYNKIDSARIFLKSPWLATDTVANKGYTLAKKILKDSCQIIIGSKNIDSVFIPFLNNGNDTLKITSVKFAGSQAAWLTARLPLRTKDSVFNSLSSGTIDTIAIAPGQLKNIVVFLDASHLTGDGMAGDTIIIGTNDFGHQFDTIPVTLEYNDLPRIMALSLSFVADKPYWLSKKAATSSLKYVFPPHAKISIKFSEPMDTSTGSKAFKAYSVFDARVSPNPPPIVFTRTWTNNDSVLTLSPTYTGPSPYFNGFQPPPNFFTPGDSVRIFISSNLTDKAKTPHGPNGLDVYENSIRAVNADTMFPLRVDSIKYDIVSVYPNNKDTGISPSPKIRIRFSSPPLPGTIDTTKHNNRCLIVRSKFYKNAQVDFDSVKLSGDSAVFTLAKQFFYGDTVSCYYRAQWARDSLGYAVDLNKNGIPMAMFDTTATEDDKQWGFIVKDIPYSGVSPAFNATSVLPTVPIVIRFSENIPLASVDTAKTGNQQLIVKSVLNKGKMFDYDSVRLKNSAIFYYPHKKFYYGDTVFCSYQGLMTKDSSKFSVALNGSKLLGTNDKADWSFIVKDIKLVSSKPDSATVSTIKPVMILTFSDPVFSGTFDTDTSAKNRSFRITSSFIHDTSFSFQTITFSSDSTQISLRPKAVFFSSDSIHCFFKGLLKQFRYDTSVNLPADSSLVFVKHDWFFYTENTGFYTYPNPYKPGIDPRHCSNAATDPCGIWFTNLHALRKDVNEVVIKIFGMNANPVFNTKTAGVLIHFSQTEKDQKPQWKWDTRNQRGELVASGLYFYVITDNNGKILIKGKLMIVR